MFSLQWGQRTRWRGFSSRGDLQLGQRAAGATSLTASGGASGRGVSSGTEGEPPGTPDVRASAVTVACDLDGARERSPWLVGAAGGTGARASPRGASGAGDGTEAEGGGSVADGGRGSVTGARGRRGSVSRRASGPGASVSRGVTGVARSSGSAGAVGRRRSVARRPTGSSVVPRNGRETVGFLMRMRRRQLSIDPLRGRKACRPASPR